MTTAQRIKTTPMGPYVGLMQGMTREDKQIVVTFLTESMAESPSPREGWAAAAKQAHKDGQDKLIIDDVLEDENLEDWEW
jgi:antitoxin MazE